tara:strand:+ start:4040 stop:4987 length:948 start_codon:yes stop_codon:yes gene_type:complete
MPNRYHHSSDDNSYGFQGQEMDDEIKGEGVSANYKYRMNDTRIGRFFATDPLEKKFSHNSPYAFSENRVIDGLELEGLEVILPNATKWEHKSVDSWYTSTSKFVGNIGVSIVNGGVDVFNYAGDLTDPDAPLTGLSFGANKFKNDAIQVGNGIKNYAENTTFDEFSSDLGNALSKPGTYEDIIGGLVTGFGIKGVSSLSKIGKITNPVPNTVARVVPILDDPVKTLGRKGAADVFVTDPKDIKGLNAKGIAKKLTIPESKSGFQIWEFNTPSNIASPIRRTDPGFVGKGKTAGGAKEYTIPNSKIPKGSKRTEVK